MPGLMVGRAVGALVGTVTGGPVGDPVEGGPGARVGVFVLKGSQVGEAELLGYGELGGTK